MTDLCKEITGQPQGILRLGKGEGDQPRARAYFLDGECDPFWIDYDMDGTATVHTDGNSYILLTGEILSGMLELVDEAIDLWETLDPFWNKKAECYEGWEHLITEATE